REGDSSYAFAAGTTSSTSVPEPAALQTVSLPRITSARSRMPGMPKCPSRPPLHLDSENGRMAGVFLRRKLFAECAECLRKVVRLHHRRSQTLHRIAALGDRLCGLVDNAADNGFRVGRPRRQQMEHALQARQQALEALEERVVQ